MDSSRKNSWYTFFFSCPSYLPFWSSAPLKKSMKSYACHILWTVHGRVLKFHIWIPHGKIADPYFFLVQIISLSGVMPLWKIRMKSCQQNISKSIWARGLKLGQLMGDDENITWLNFFLKIHLIFPESWPFENFDIVKLSARYLENYLS